MIGPFDIKALEWLKETEAVRWLQGRGILAEVEGQLTGDTERVRNQMLELRSIAIEMRKNVGPKRLYIGNPNQVLVSKLFNPFQFEH